MTALLSNDVVPQAPREPGLDDVHLVATPISKYIGRWLPLALALLLKPGIAPAAEINASSQSVLTFIEVRIEMRGHAGNVLRQQTGAAGENPASPGQMVVMQEIARPERFAALERMPSAASTADGREAGAFTKGIIDDLIAPPDRRLSELDEIANSNGPTVDARANLYVITNLDIAPSNLGLVETALHGLAAAARQSNGNLSVEILRQINHPNHFNLITAWIGEAPFHAFAASVGAREFRQTIAPLLGSPYDERLFRRVV